MTRRVFPDTGVLVAMLACPVNRFGRPTLAGEVRSLSSAGAVDLVVSRAVIDELEEVVDRDFPALRGRLASLLRPFASGMTRRPTPAEVARALPFATDPDDAPIFAAAAASGAEIVLSNDFRAFHTPLAQRYWAQHGMVVESLYGLLCLLGRRERRLREAAGELVGEW